MKKHAEKSIVDTFYPNAFVNQCHEHKIFSFKYVTIGLCNS